MANKSFTETNKAFTRKNMSNAEAVQDEISDLLRRLASPVAAGESVKECIRRASKRSGVPYGQVRRAWYKNWRLIPAYVADQIRQRAAQHDEHVKRQLYRAIVSMQESDPVYFDKRIESLSQYLLLDGGEVPGGGKLD
jgi:hypothetical protein